MCGVWCAVCGVCDLDAIATGWSGRSGGSGRPGRGGGAVSAPLNLGGMASVGRTTGSESASADSKRKIHVMGGVTVVNRCK